MQDPSSTWRHKYLSGLPLSRHRLITFYLLIFLIASGDIPALAQQGRAVARQSLPSPEKIVGDYLKAMGGKKRQASIQDATYEWTLQLKDQTSGSARTQVKAPASTRADIILNNGEINAAANTRSAWMRGLDGNLRTLTDLEAGAAKLQAALNASRLVDYKKQKILARTVALEQTSDGPAYIVEFSTRDGARLRYWFSASSKLLLKTTDEARRITTRFSDYHAAGGPLEPHRVEVEKDGGEAYTLTLQSARYNTGARDTLFDPPGDGALNIPALLRELARNQTEVDKRINEYTYTRKETERKINDRGEVTKETVKVYEVYPVVGWGRILKLVSENGVPLSPERAAKEEKRVAEELTKAERELPKLEQKRELKRAERAAKKKSDGTDEDDGEADDNVGISTFLRVCDFVSPRRERFRDRETIVFDFRARPGYRPRNRSESIVAKLTGVVWIDPIEKHIMRLEARFAQGFKLGGGLLASIRPGSAFVFEQTRLPDGVWLPRFAQVNASAKFFLFAGLDLNAMREYSDYKRFSTKAGDAQLENPKEQTPKAPLQ